MPLTLFNQIDKSGRGVIIDDDLNNFIESFNKTVELKSNFKTYLNMFTTSVSSQNNGVLSF